MKIDFQTQLLPRVSFARFEWYNHGGIFEYFTI